MVENRGQIFKIPCSQGILTGEAERFAYREVFPGYCLPVLPPPPPRTLPPMPPNDFRIFLSAVTRCCRTDSIAVLPPGGPLSALRSVWHRSGKRNGDPHDQ